MTATKRFRVAVHVMTKRRDLASRYVLAKLLEKQGCDVFLTSVHNYIPVLKYWRPHGFVHTTASKMRPVAEACPSTKLFLYVGEGNEGKDAATETDPIMDDFVRERLGRIYVWGEKSLERIHNDLKAHQRTDLVPILDSGSGVKVAGFPRGDISKFMPPLPEGTQTTIGISAHFPLLNVFDGRPTLLFGFGNEIKIPQIEREIRELRTTTRIIDHIVKHTPYNINLRPYPLEAHEGYKAPVSKAESRFINPAYEGRVEIDSTPDFTSWARNQRMIISSQSTAITETLLLGVPFVNTDILSGNREFVNKISPIHKLFGEFGYSPETYEELFKALEDPEKIEMHAERVKELWEQEYALNDSSGSALDFVTRDIVGCLNQSMPSHTSLLPKTILRWADEYLFWKMRRREPFECNFHYKKGVDSIPPEYDEIVNRILASRTTG